MLGQTLKSVVGLCNSTLGIVNTAVVASNCGIDELNKGIKELLHSELTEPKTERTLTPAQQFLEERRKELLKSKPNTTTTSVVKPKVNLDEYREFQAKYAVVDWVDGSTDTIFNILRREDYKVELELALWFMYLKDNPNLVQLVKNNNTSNEFIVACVNESEEVEREVINYLRDIGHFE